MLCQTRDTDPDLQDAGACFNSQSCSQSLRFNFLPMQTDAHKARMHAVFLNADIHKGTQKHDFITTATICSSEMFSVKMTLWLSSLCTWREIHDDNERFDVVFRLCSTAEDLTSETMWLKFRLICRDLWLVFDGQVRLVSHQKWKVHFHFKASAPLLPSADWCRKVWSCRHRLFAGSCLKCWKCPDLL